MNSLACFSRSTLTCRYRILRCFVENSGSSINDIQYNIYMVVTTALPLYRIITTLYWISLMLLVWVRLMVLTLIMSVFGTHDYDDDTDHDTDDGTSDDTVNDTNDDTDDDTDDGGRGIEDHSQTLFRHE